MDDVNITVISVSMLGINAVGYTEAMPISDLILATVSMFIIKK